MEQTVTITGRKTSGEIFTKEMKRDCESFSLNWPNNLVTLDLSELKHCKKLKSFYLEKMDKLEELELSPLGHCPELEEITLFVVDLPEIDFSFLKNCSKFKKLSCDYTHFSKIDLSSLQYCPEFQSLYLLHGNLRELNLKPLANCKKLKILSLWRNPLHSLDLSPLAACKQLETVFLEDNSLSDIDLSFLEGNGTLKELNLENNFLKEIDFTPLRNCSKLEILNLASNEFEELDFSPLSNLESLKLIDLCHNKNLKKLSFDFSINLPHLETLEAFWCGIEEINLAGLVNSNNLNALYLKGNNLKNIDLSSLKNSQLENLDLSFNSLSSLDLTVLSDCPELKYLLLEGNNFKTIDLQPLRHCSQLEWLYLNMNQLVGVDLKPLANSGKLKELVLENNQLKSLDLSPLSNLKSLETLKLAQNPLIGLDDCCNGEMPCPIRIDLPPLATGKLDVGPLAACPQLTEISYDLSCEIINEDKLSKKVRKIVYTYLTGTKKDGSKTFFLNDIFNHQLDLSKQSLKTIDLNRVPKSSKLITLQMNNNFLETLPLENTQLPSVKHFEANCNQLQEIDFRLLKRAFPNLEKMDLGYNELKEIKLDTLKDWETFKIIDLRDNEKLVIDIQELEKNSKLEEIIVTQNMVVKNKDDTKVTIKIFDRPVLKGRYKDGSKSRTEIQVSGEANSASIQIRMEEHESIDLTSIKEILPIVTFVNLSYLELPEINLEPLARSTQLTYLSLTNNNFSEIDLSPLKNCKELETLSLSSCDNLKEIDITPLLNLKQLRNFYLNDTVKIYAERNSLVGELPFGLKAWYSEAIIWT